MKTQTVKQHMAAIAVLGGKSTFKKRGRKHYVKMAKVRWANREAKIQAAIKKAKAKNAR